MNPVEIEEAVSQLALDSFDRREFPFSFLRAFGNPETTIKRLRTGSTNQSDVGGVLQRSNIHIATCGAGEVEATLGLLRDSPKTATAKAKFILATDGDSFQAEDRTSGETVACDYADFPDKFGFFLPLAGITTIEQIRESSFDIRATGRLNKLYVELLKDNPDWAKAERRPDMNHFMARLIFCLFAEDTDIFVGEGLFTKTVEQMSARDSSDTHTVISEIFRSMDTKIADRQTAGIARYATQFPYVNGQLFSGSTEVPRFTKIARSYLNHIGNLNWKKINPDIFGSMIQAVADDEERGALGMHYTSVPNILKVLNPLFLNDLREKLDEADDNGRKLLNLRNRIARIRVFDPACGSGNFLVIAYKQMREIEAEINRRRGELDRRSDIPLTNFRGIELRDFPAEVARLALIIAEFQCDILYRGQKEALAEFLPLNTESWITCGNALRLDWLSICPPTGNGERKIFADDLYGAPLDQAKINFANEGGETYLCGNPPYKGSSWQTIEQKADLEWVAGKQVKRWKSLDYVAGWFIKAASYVVLVDAAFAFVSTKTICEGEQVPALWPHLLDFGLNIFFAHLPFNWSNLASNKAGVTVVVVGMKKWQGKSFLYDEIGQREVESIGPYLAPNSLEIIEKVMRPLAGQAKMLRGNMPTDGGYFLMSRDEMKSGIQAGSFSREFVRPYKGASEILNGTSRYCLWIEPHLVDQALSNGFIAHRIREVEKMRASSNAPTTRNTKVPPYRFMQIEGTAKFHSIVVPAITSINREFLPIALEHADTILSNKAYVAYDAPLWNFAIAVSTIHKVWISTICARMRADYSYSNTLGWNTFPIPQLTERNRGDLTRCAENILLAREIHFPATIADLYDPDKMPADLRRAHEENDELLERIYIGRRFRNDTERLEKLFELYTKMTSKKVAA